MTYKEQLRKIWRQYEVENGEEPHTVRECFDWAVERGLWAPRPQDIAKIFGREMSEALRQEIRVDEQGRHYRAKHCVRENRGGVQLALWNDIDRAPRSFMEKSFQQRRQGIVRDSYQLKMDVDHFNDSRSKGNPIQLILNFEDDVAEIEAEKAYGDGEVA
ncbi:hypothetical protein ACTU44_17675 [Thalassospira sp. SM2505]|uniref:Uncharacterized protein n=1 Tax=Thalassospira profundimaris TaxID=502049 RepID=A0A367WX31_9PROT|nr:hypothetical protein [Thalassospira profundimaris]RCK45071.1 hypothetical protein TH30_13785 [Thalassospira profundimaris]